jgi:hypothetical protein
LAIDRAVWPVVVDWSVRSNQVICQAVARAGLQR